TDRPWTIRVNWGDGSPVTVFTASRQGAIARQNHTYPNVQTVATVTVTVSDKDGAQGSSSFVVNTYARDVQPPTMVQDINSKADPNRPARYLTNVNGPLFFTVFTVGSGYELWKSDGTAAGTVLVKDILPGIGSSNPSALTNVNGTLYFTADDG